MTSTIVVPAPTADDLAAEAAALERTWAQRPGVIGWLSTTDHKAIGRRYIVTAFCFFLAGGINAALIRAQLARPEGTLLGPDTYNQVFTVHGSTMMFLFAVPMMNALGIYFVPLMVGARNIAFPRLNAFGYYVYLIGGLLLYVGLLTNTGPDAGWFSYVPLAGPAFSPGKRVDIWAQMVTFTEIAALVAAIEIIVTVFKCRAPRMSIDRLPLFVWSQLVVSFMIVFAMPWVATGSTFMLAADRLVSTQFFNTAEGGDALLWQHVFWFFGHPEVYIIFLPGLGMVSQIVGTFSRREVFGYTAIVLSMVATGFLSFGLWVHHMFATTVPMLGESFFSAASAMIAIPTGVQFFCWIVTLWTGRPRISVPLLFVLGFAATFLIGGLSGVMIASVPFDLQVHDTFFIVAHFHYVLLGGAVFPLFGAFYYWFPKVTGRMLNEKLGVWQFWLFLIGVNVTFFPMHRLGLDGMPRRVYTYLPGTGWGTLNLVASIGAAVITVSVILFLINVIRSWTTGPRASDDPWEADSLEWATSSPPPSYNFVYVPVVEGRSALWDRSPERPIVRGLRTDIRQALLTTVIDARPDSLHRHPEPSIVPFLAALATSTTIIVLIFTPWGLPIGGVLLLFTLIAWGWPSAKDHARQVRAEASEPA